MAFASLGPVVFETSSELIRTFSDVSHKTSARWTAHEVIARKPAQEFLGPALRTLRFAVRLDVSFGVDPDAEADILRDAAEDGEVLAFVLAGVPRGDWAILELRESWRHVTGAGVVRVIDLDLSLEEYA